MDIEVNSRKRGISYVVWGTLFLVILGGINYAMYIAPNFNKPPLIFGILFNTIWFLVSWGMISTGKKQMQTEGSWFVTVDESGFSWTSPNYDQAKSIDQSFRYSLDEINYVEVHYPSRSKKRKFPRFYIHQQDGKVRELRTNSGINIDKVFKELEKFGIKYITAVGEKSQKDLDESLSYVTN